MPERIYYIRDDQKVVFNPSNGDYSLMRGNPVICIMSDRNPKEGTIKYGYAVLHPEDEANFSKAQGRAEAKKKLDEEPLELTTEAITGHTINKSIVEHFSKTIGKKNGKVRKLTHRWLKVAAAKARFAAAEKAKAEEAKV